MTHSDASRVSLNTPRCQTVTYYVANRYACGDKKSERMEQIEVLFVATKYACIHHGITPNITVKRALSNLLVYKK